ncbi:MAG: LytTR family transcriptional regulator DNA-binding domain-containing protein [Prevotella sp.]|nr:LytTR family transcriptional regulator DNA-binding domain-containing protein [Prevotella sp.]
MRKKRFLFIIFATVFCLFLKAQTESHLTYRRYTTQDGLPQMQTERLWQDSRGYIYIGTLSGFVRFDGKSFTPFLKGRRLNIVGFTETGNEVRALGFFRHWKVGYEDVTPLPLDPQHHWLLNNLNAGSLPNGYILMEDSLEQHRRLCRMTKNRVQPVLIGSLLDEMTPDRKLFIDSLHYFIPTEHGLYQARRGSGKTVRISNKHDIYTLLRTKQGLLVFASDGIYHLKKRTMKRLVAVDWSAASYGLTVRMLRSGSMVIADEHSIYLYDGNTIRQLFTGINLIRDVLVDCWDRLWIATYQGVYCFFNRCFTNHVLADENDIVRAVAEDKTGKLIMGTLNGKVLANRQIIDANPEQFYAPNAVRIGDDIFMAGNGDIARITDSKLHWLGLPHDRYQFVAEAWGQLITGNRNGIIAYNLLTATFDTLTTKILHPWCAAHDNSGRLWIGSSSGVFSITKDRKVTKTEYKQQKLIVSTMDADKQGTIFFASADSVFMIRQDEAEPLNPQLPQLQGHEVRSLHVSPRGYLIIAVVDGLFLCRISTDYQVSDTRFFNHLNGFTMTEPLKAMMTETADGRIWLPGLEQISSFSPSDLLAYNEEDTYIIPPLKWWQHWWVWLIGLLLLSLLVWSVTRWYEKHRHLRRMMQLQREKMQREELIEEIRKKAIEELKANSLAKDIVEMTENHADERITMRTASGTIVVNVNDIAYFKGDGNYSQIVTFYDKDTILMSLGALEKKLNPEIFVRADRSTLVNIQHVSSLFPKQRRCIFRSSNGQEVETTLLAPAFKRLQKLL